MSTCQFGGKVAYQSENAAKKARIAMGRNLNVNDLRVYQCPNCYKWHFTSRKD